MGSAWAFVIAFGCVVVWAITGPLFHFSDTWQLVINTATTVITFLMIFLVQNTQNRDTRSIHLKLDELIRSNEKARNSLLDLEDLSDEDLKRLAAEFRRLRVLGDRVERPASDQSVPGDTESQNSPAAIRVIEGSSGA